MTTAAKFKNHGQIIRDLVGLSKTLEKDVREEIAQKVADIVQEKAAATSPVKTGRLRRGWVGKLFKSKGPAQAFVAANYRVAPHAHLIEYGTRFISARNVLSRAVTGTRSRAADAAQAILDKFIQGANR